MFVIIFKCGMGQGTKPGRLRGRAETMRGHLKRHSLVGRRTVFFKCFAMFATVTILFSPRFYGGDFLAFRIRPRRALSPDAWPSSVRWGPAFDSGPAFYVSCTGLKELAINMETAVVNRLPRLFVADGLYRPL